jgi:cysteine desulfurase
MAHHMVTHGTIYLDNNATTPVDPRVVDVMSYHFRNTYGNSSSRDHAFGWEAAEAVEEARWHVAELINARPIDIIFTSGATEGVTWALQGIRHRAQVERAFTAATEHESVLENCRAREAGSGLRIQYLPLTRDGQIEMTAAVDAVEASESTFVSVMLANNEIGNIYPIRELAGAAHKAGALFFSDITQAVGKVPVDVRALGIDLGALSAHKMYGPKGVGALYLRRDGPKIELDPLILGGAQERGLRAGTLNVPGIVGFGEACRVAKSEIERDAYRMQALRDRLEKALLLELPDVWFNGDRDARLPNTTNIGFAGVDARTLIRDMRDVAVSTQSACSSATGRPSHVLKALGLTDHEAYSCVRFSVGRFTTEDEIDRAITRVVTSVRKLRHTAPRAGWRAGEA